jgi:aminoglycoside 3-N-acetyltransferase
VNGALRLRAEPDDLVAALRSVGVGTGMTLYVAASLTGLALLPDPASMVLDALNTVVGESGTIVMPTFHPGFRYHGLFDRERSPSTSGVLSEAFRLSPGTLRTWFPAYNPVAVRGAQAPHYAAIRSATAFGPGSVFDDLVSADATVLLWGCRFHDGVAHVHWLEERHSVPYRAWEDFTGLVARDGITGRHTWPCHIRRPGVELDAGPLGVVLAASGVVREADVALSRLAAFSLRDFAKVADPWFASNWSAMVRG